MRLPLTTWSVFSPDSRIAQFFFLPVAVTSLSLYPTSRSCPLGRMAIIPLLRTIVFALVTLLSLVVLGICAHIEYLTSGDSSTYLSFAAFGLGSACVTVVTLPLFFILGHARRGVFTSMIIFEIIWFRTWRNTFRTTETLTRLILNNLVVLWVLWVATSGDTVVDRAFFFPEGCILNNYPTANQICYEVTVVEAFAFLNFFAVFFYYDVLVLYAIISAIRGRGIWTMSVREAANGGPSNPAIVMTQPPYPQQVAPQYAQYPEFQKAPPATGYPSTVNHTPLLNNHTLALNSSILAILNNNILALLNNSILVFLNSSSIPAPNNSSIPVPNNNSIQVFHSRTISFQVKVTTLPTRSRWETTRFPSNLITTRIPHLIPHKARCNPTRPTLTSPMAVIFCWSAFY
ncbi:hypothetical protein EDD15DRAFT_1916970 [Pisolithus albus]|nr:hypothetical protein EDD15DRAFT_1916970 [Pisolithus albus]